MQPQNAKEALRLALPNYSGRSVDIFLGNLLYNEPSWAALRPFLASRGYRLRPRYQPDWIPSWTNYPGPIDNLRVFEDALTPPRSNLMDAVRERDGLKVVLKCVDIPTEEIELAQYLNSPQLLSDPRNRSVRILEIIPLPDDKTRALIVMPLLLPFSILPFRRVGEFAEAVSQFLQGLEFMHEHKIAHRDACFYNLMMDGSRIVPRGFHFLNPWTHDGVNRKGFEWRDRWSVRPVQYYFIDFGLSHRYPSSAQNIKDTGIFGQDDVPEHSLETPYDPFKSDVYQLGNVILKVLSDYEGMELFVQLGRAMTNKKPDERPSPSEALKLLASLDKGTLRRRIWRRSTSSRDRFMIKYCRAKYVV
ncbi:hypothetical protein Hypma_002163 [Hypsizygus marmoreus]|uniref:Protein kinase domain-containing protein n=1 Tax=Hypsizygus marmoreus TaxID=39966 RepID=A0A369KAJ0_HYPMA|nr:hypothetical protein Hypma_002163 [Hypsizygus marmoreus]